jgi:hypothetical protein
MASKHRRQRRRSFALGVVVTLLVLRWAYAEVQLSRVQSRVNYIETYLFALGGGQSELDQSRASLQALGGSR